MDNIYKEVKNIALPIYVMGFIFYLATLTFSNYKIINIGVIIVSCTYSILCFFMVGASIVVAIEKTKNKAQIYVTLQYFVRYLITGSLIYYTFKINVFNTFIFVVPLFFPKVYLLIKGLYDYKKSYKKEV